MPRTRRPRRRHVLQGLREPLRLKIIETNKVGRNVVPAALFYADESKTGLLVHYSQPRVNNMSLQVFCSPGKTFDTPVALIGTGVEASEHSKFSVRLYLPQENSPLIRLGSVVGYKSWDLDQPERYRPSRPLYVMPAGTMVSVVRPPANLDLLAKYEEIYPGAVLMTVSGAEEKIHRVYVFVPGSPEERHFLADDPGFDTTI